MTGNIVHLLSDHGLVTDARAGDSQALNTLIGAVRAAVVPYARSRLSGYAGGLEAAEDVSQETCVAVVSVLPRYQDQGAPFAAFVYAIAAHKVADAQRRFGRPLLTVAEVPDQADVAPTPEERVMAAAQARAARELLLHLPPRSQRVVQLRAEGLSAEAVGQTVGMTANAVRVTQHRATLKLRQLLLASADHLDIFDRPSPLVAVEPPAA